MAGKKGKKGGGGGPAKVELTDEQRRAQRAAAKAELRVRMEEEAKNSKMNGLKILNQWRKIMRLAKAESLKKDVEILSQNHERDVDRKDAILQMLDRDLEEAEDQFQVAMRSHLVNMDALIKLHDSRLYALERNFQTEITTIQRDFHKEKTEMIARFGQEKKELSSIIETIEKEEQDRENEAKHAFEQLREEIRNRNSEDINMLRISLDAQIEELETLFESAHLNYLQQTAQRTHDFKELTQNDQKLTADIEKMRKKIDSLQTSIQQWRAKIKQLTRETEERNRLLLEEKRTIQKHYQQLKQRIEVYRGTQNQGLLNLSQSANKCKLSLQEKLELARRVVHLSEACRRMETVNEQVMPFAHAYISKEKKDREKQMDLPDEEQRDEDGNVIAVRKNLTTPITTAKKKLAESAAMASSGGVEENSKLAASNSLLRNLNPHGLVPPAHQSSVWTTATSVAVKSGTHATTEEDLLADDSNLVFVQASERLSNFHLKYNQILLDNFAIEKERDRLAHENAQLQDLIQQYMSGVQLSDDVLHGDNPLFVVNGRANLNNIPPVRGLRPTIQDAVQITNSTVRQHTHVAY